MCFILAIHFLKGKKMKKIRAFNICVTLALVLFNANLAIAEVSNPFTIKGDNEFTQTDRRKLEDNLKNEMNEKLSTLENKIQRELESIKSSPTNNSRQSNSGRQQPGYSGEFDGGERFEPGFDEGMQPQDAMKEKEVAKPEEKTPLQIKMETAMFLGCIDKQAMFKDNKTQERFFVPLKEVKNNEEINKMGGCSL